MINNKAFTLVELVVVVSIIAILVGTGLPSLIEAHVRAKVSATCAEMKVLQLAVETYCVDQHVYPRMSFQDSPYNDFYDGFGGPTQPLKGTLGSWVTTPVAYLAKFDRLQPFDPGPGAPTDQRLYGYAEDASDSAIWPSVDWQVVVRRKYHHQMFGAYHFIATGPDASLGITFLERHTAYDPTNGTVSQGNILTSHNSPIAVAVYDPATWTH